MELIQENIDNKDDKWLLTTVYEFDTKEAAEEYLDELKEIESSNQEILNNKKLIDELNAKVEELLREVGQDIEGLEILI